MKQNNKKINPGEERLCDIFCYGCLKRFGHEKGAHEYQKWVHYRDVRLKHSPITGKAMPVTGCARCNSSEARITKIYKRKKTKEDILEEVGIKDELQLKKKQESSLERYAKKYGTKQARKDFLQPYSDPEGTPSEEFVEAYMGREQVEDLYSEEKLKEKGMTKLIDRKKEKEKFKQNESGIFLK